MVNGAQQVDVFGIQDRRKSGKARPWIARWRIDGHMVSRSFRTRVEADRFRSVLLQAVTAGEPFDRETGEPVSWSAPPPEAASLTVFNWTRRWLAEQWPEWQPRTRRSAIEALCRFVPLVIADDGPPPPSTMRSFLRTALEPGDAPDPADPNLLWLTQHGRTLAQLTKANLGPVDVALGLKAKGEPLGARTANRWRTVAHSCIRRAVQLDVLPADPWPPPSKGRAARKVNRRRNAIDVHTADLTERRPGRRSGVERSYIECMLNDANPETARSWDVRRPSEAR